MSSRSRMSSSRSTRSFSRHEPAFACRAADPTLVCRAEVLRPGDQALAYAGDQSCRVPELGHGL